MPTHSPRPSSRLALLGRQVLRITVVSALVTACASLSSNAIHSGRTLSMPEASAPPVMKAPTASSTVSAKQLATIQDSDLSEASGMAALNEDFVWLINDGGNGPVLYAVGLDGKVRAKITVEGVSNRDWEDMAQLRVNGRSYLVIADMGDNLQRHANYRLIIIEPPTLPTKGLLQGRVQPKTVLNFRYEDGSHDAESIAYDPARQKLLILTKRDRPPRLYELAFDPEAPSPSSARTAQFIAELPPLPKPTLMDVLNNPLLGHFATQPTAMDMSPDGLRLAVLTYNRIYLFRRTHLEQRWATAIKQAPFKLLDHRLAQAEAISFSHDGRGVLYTTERSPAPLWFATLPAPSHTEQAKR